MNRRPLSLLLGWAMIFGLLAPVLHTVWVSFSPDSFLTPPTGEWSSRWYRAFFDDRRWIAALLRSQVVAVLAAITSVMAAGPIAYAVNAGEFSGRRLLVILVLLPACVPVATLGMGILAVFYVTGLWSTIGGLVLVHATLGLPIAFLIIRSHLTPALHECQLAARGLGANSWQIARRIVIPLLRPAFVAASVAVFVLSLNESLVTLFLTTPNTETLPAIIWPQLRYSPTPMVAVASCITAIIGATGVVIVFRTVVASRAE